jgi:hypothetical protein
MAGCMVCVVTVEEREVGMCPYLMVEDTDPYSVGQWQVSNLRHD